MPTASEKVQSRSDDDGDNNNNNNNDNNNDNDNNGPGSAEAHAQEQSDLVTQNAIQALARQFSHEQDSPPLAIEVQGPRASVPAAATRASNPLPRLPPATATHNSPAGASPRLQPQSPLQILAHPHPHTQHHPQQLAQEPASSPPGHHLRWKELVTVEDARGHAQAGLARQAFGVPDPATQHHYNRVEPHSPAQSQPAQHRPQDSLPFPNRPSLTPLSQPSDAFSILSNGQPTPVTPHQQHGSLASRIPSAKPYPRQPVLYFGPQRADSPAHQLPSRDRVLSKPVIMDPPARKTAPAPVPPPSQSEPRGTFPSPTRDHAAVNTKFVDDVARMTFAVQQSLPEAVRRIVRDNWEKCLLGSEFHQAFVFNAAIHHAMPSITRRAVRDFGQKLVRDSKAEVIGHYTRADLDEVVDYIINKASNEFLDKCLEARLTTIEAKNLINFLARADRLGYAASDIVVDDEQGRVIPQASAPSTGVANGFTQSAASLSAAPQAHGMPRQAVPAPAPGSGASPALQCMSCYRTFQFKAAYDYHHREKVCKCLAPGNQGFAHACTHCGQGFTDLNDMQHHVAHNFCGEPPRPAKRGPGRPPRASGAPHSPAANVPTSQPSSAAKLAAPIFYTPSGTPKAGSGVTGDPYAHLSAEQLDAMHKELREADFKYAPRFAEIEAIEDEGERGRKLDSLRNSFGTRQSMIRKKFGVRLRERRTKAEIQADRDRLATAITHAKKELGSADGAVATANAVSTLMQQQQQQQQHEPSQAQAGVGSGWSAANTATATNEARSMWAEHDAKRRRLDYEGGYDKFGNDGRGADDTPSRKAIVPVSQMTGGLGGSAATASTRDPTLQRAPPPAPRPAAIMQEPAEMVDLTQSPMGNGTDMDSPHPSAAFADAASRPASSQFVDPAGGAGDPVHALMGAGAGVGNTAAVPVEDDEMEQGQAGRSDDTSDEDIGGDNYSEDNDNSEATSDEE